VFGGERAAMAEADAAAGAGDEGDLIAEATGRRGEQAATAYLIFFATTGWVSVYWLAF